MTIKKKAQYDIEYRKKHKKQFNTDLNIEEYEELNNFLKKKKITKAQFVRDAFKKLKEEYDKDLKDYYEE